MYGQGKTEVLVQTPVIVPLFRLMYIWTSMALKPGHCPVRVKTHIQRGGAERSGATSNL